MQRALGKDIGEQAQQLLALHTFSLASYVQRVAQGSQPNAAVVPHPDLSVLRGGPLRDGVLLPGAVVLVALCKIGVGEPITVDFGELPQQPDGIAQPPPGVMRLSVPERWVQLLADAARPRLASSASGRTRARREGGSARATGLNDPSLALYQPHQASGLDSDEEGEVTGQRGDREPRKRRLERRRLRQTLEKALVDLGVDGGLPSTSSFMSGELFDVERIREELEVRRVVPGDDPAGRQHAPTGTFTAEDQELLNELYAFNTGLPPSLCHQLAALLSAGASVAGSAQHAVASVAAFVQEDGMIRTDLLQQYAPHAEHGPLWTQVSAHNTQQKNKVQANNQAALRTSNFGMPEPYVTDLSHLELKSLGAYVKQVAFDDRPIMPSALLGILRKLPPRGDAPPAWAENLGLTEQCKLQLQVAEWAELEKKYPGAEDAHPAGVWFLNTHVQPFQLLFAPLRDMALRAESLQQLHDWLKAVLISSNFASEIRRISKANKVPHFVYIKEFLLRLLEIGEELQRAQRHLDGAEAEAARGASLATLLRGEEGCCSFRSRLVLLGHAQI
jgi:hypothetical protein